MKKTKVILTLAILLCGLLSTSKWEQSQNASYDVPEPMGVMKIASYDVPEPMGIIRNA